MRDEIVSGIIANRFWGNYMWRDFSKWVSRREGAKGVPINQLIHEYRIHFLTS